MLKVAKDSALKARIQTNSQMKALIVTTPADLRQALHDLSANLLTRRCVGFQPGDVGTPTAAAKLALRSLPPEAGHQQLT